MMKRFVSLMALVGALMFLAPSPVSAQQPPEEQQREFGEFVPFDQLPPSEQLPAAPLLVAAYAFAWVVVFFYVWTVWRRMTRVEAEMKLLEKRQLQRGDAGPGINRTNPR